MGAGAISHQNRFLHPHQGAFRDDCQSHRHLGVKHRHRPWNSRTQPVQIRQSNGRLWWWDLRVHPTTCQRKHVQRNQHSGQCPNKGQIYFDGGRDKNNSPSSVPAWPESSMMRTLIPIKETMVAAITKSDASKWRHSRTWKPTAVHTVFIQSDSTTKAPPAAGRKPSTRRKPPWGRHVLAYGHACGCQTTDTPLMERKKGPHKLTSTRDCKHKNYQWHCISYNKADEESIHIIYELKTAPELIRYHHAAAVFPT